jgi:acetoin utilization deacetylase AcuC-like enzyme
MSTVLFTHPACLAHDTGDYHPECAERLRAILAALEGEEFALLHREAAPRATTAQILRVHSAEHLDSLLDRLPPEGHHAYLDPDTVISAGSWEAALRAAGAAVAAVDEVCLGACRNAFCAVRPPGHHAERAKAMGFCLLNNVAIAAMHARIAHGLKRVAVIDFDVHHGNGTQEAFFANSELFYASTHQHPCYPGTGLAEERGCADNLINVPLAPGTGSRQWRTAMASIILPRLRTFRPELIIVSAGFDAHAADPLAEVCLCTEDYSWVTHEICALARETCNHRLVSVLEGGYDLRSLAMSCAAHVRALMGF